MTTFQTLLSLPCKLPLTGNRAADIMTIAADLKCFAGIIIVKNADGDCYLPYSGLSPETPLGVFFGVNMPRLQITGTLTAPEIKAAYGNFSLKLTDGGPIPVYVANPTTPYTLNCNLYAGSDTQVGQWTSDVPELERPYICGICLHVPTVDEPWLTVETQF